MKMPLIIDNWQSNAKRFALPVIYCIFSIIFFISATSFSLINSYETKAQLIAVDNFGNFYSSSNNGILKFSPDGKYLYRYEEFRYGKIVVIDVSNPLKMLVFYRD